MNDATSQDQLAIDIGSTVVKLARLDADGTMLGQEFVPRDFDAGIARQVTGLLQQFGDGTGIDGVRLCSSANGGLRIGILSLTDHYSGAVLRNQALSAGANPIFVESFDHSNGSLQSVDVLLIGGGIDIPDAAPMQRRLETFDAGAYHYRTLVYAGNKYLAEAFKAHHPEAVIVDNPLAGGLRGEHDSVFETLRRAYLDDLVYKEGISELHLGPSHSVRPTPEVVNQGFRLAVLNRTGIAVPGSCVLVDIGGATTDLHYTVEIVRDDSANRPAPGASIARYVFTDLGIVYSRDSTLSQMRNHPRIYDFLCGVIDGDVRDVYRRLRESDFEPEPRLLAYGCLFLALDRFAEGRAPGLPAVSLSKVSQFILTGGASQLLDEDRIKRIIDLATGSNGNVPGILIDRAYQIWVDGIGAGGL
jgi:hypothetical protein